jgi:hypothetical protein
MIDLLCLLLPVTKVLRMATMKRLFYADEQVTLGMPGPGAYLVVA